MDVVLVSDIIRKGLWVMLKAGLPILFSALCVGLIVSLVQAVTQIQEQTLSFIPKILTVFGVLIFIFPYMVSILSDYSQELFDTITRFS